MGTPDAQEPRPRSGGVPRVVVVTRPSEYESLLWRHGTHEQARFFLAGRGQSIDGASERHQRQGAALAVVSRAIPAKWRRSQVTRADLSRFVFEDGDVVVTVGQDGLVANVARYAGASPVVGINPDPARYDGVLARHAPERLGALLPRVVGGDCAVESRTRCEVRTDDGQRLTALNELFLGHRTHQSARYRLRLDAREERQSSSGVIVATGTGATGWARSIARERAAEGELPAPGAPSLFFFVREAFPSVATGTTLTAGRLGAAPLCLISEMDEGGAIFGDGVEDDRLEWGYGVCATIAAAPEALRLVI